MVDAGLTPPFIGRVRRAATGGLSEGQIRRLVRARSELEELDRRRGTILRMLGAESAGPEEGGELRSGPKAPESVIEAVRACMDRFDLEDLFLPHRRPEPEVQLALDRGLARLADDLVAPLPPERRAAAEPAGEIDAQAEAEAEAEVEEAPAAAEGDGGASEAAADASATAADAEVHAEAQAHAEATAESAAAPAP